MVSPLARGLFHQAILESGSCLGPWGPGSKEHGLNVTQRMMHALNVSSLAELRALPPQHLIMWSPWEDGYDVEFPGYWVDGWILPDHPNHLLQSAENWNIDAVLLGGT